MPESAHSRLWSALVVSALVHVGLLTMVVEAFPVRLAVATKPVLAVLKIPNQALPAGIAVPLPASSDSSARLRTAPQLIPVQPVRKATGGRPVDSAALALPAPGKAESLLPSPSPSPSVSEGGASPAGTSNVPSEGASADDLRQYRVALAIAARRFKRYPLLARERGWAGRVEVAVNLSAWQPNPRLSLVQSSGHAALDEQALSMIEQASATTTLPESLRGKDFRVLLPIEFTLEDDH